jgi:hypothetical protein|tara:strand:+ start:3359 stop:3583 length:225 start_codon:yes stop_codon:yes gene_type:complete
MSIRRYNRIYDFVIKNEDERYKIATEWCNPKELPPYILLDKLIKHFESLNQYEKCSTLLKIKCWRAKQDKKYNL